MRSRRTLEDYMGNTPIVQIKNYFGQEYNDVYVKLEEFNPGGSIKSRIALEMINCAENNGVLKPNSGQTIIEPTGGNTGLGLAMLGSIRGYEVILVIPDNFSKEKMKVLQAYGAKIVLSDSKLGNDSHIWKTREIIEKNPDYVWLNQFSNASNPNSHYKSTANEILADIDAPIDFFITGVGSGGTISGIGKRLKEVNPKTSIIAVQPEGCDVLSGKAIKHKIIALALGFVPEVFDVKLVDEAFSVSYKDASLCMRYLAKNEGLMVGISSGANIYAACSIARKSKKNANIVTVAPDSGRSYLDDFFDKKG